MKKIVAAVAALAFTGSVAFAQEAPKTEKKASKKTEHKMEASKEKEAKPEGKMDGKMEKKSTKKAKASETKATENKAK